MNAITYDTKKIMIYVIGKSVSDFQVPRGIPPGTGISPTISAGKSHNITSSVQKAVINPKSSSKIYRHFMKFIL